MKKVPSQAKGIGTFSFWDDFEVGGVFLNVDKKGQDKMSSIFIFQLLPRILRLKMLRGTFQKLFLLEREEFANEFPKNM